MQDKPLKLLYVLGVGHCGSTVLNLAADHHPDMMGLGEIAGLMDLDNPDIAKNPVWAAAAEAFRAATPKDGAALQFNPPQIKVSDVLTGNRPPAAWAEENIRFLRDLQKTTGCDVLVDSSKEWRRLWGLLEAKNVDIKVVYLTRDGRGVLNAYQRKYGTWKEGAKRLVKIDIAAFLLRRLHVRSDNWMTLRYEDLAHDPEKACKRLCQHMGLDFDAAMLTPDTKTYRGLGGNRMRLKPFQGFKLDEKWCHDTSSRWKIFSSLGLIPYHLRHRYALWAR